MANEQRRSALAFPTTASCSTEAALKSDKFLVIAHGTADEVAKAKIILETTSSEKIDHPFGDIGNLTGNFAPMESLARFAATARKECAANSIGGTKTLIGFFSRCFGYPCGPFAPGFYVGPGLPSLP